MPIGPFARRSGLTASALRFYADAGLLPPAEVDPVTGYRFYGEDQLERAVLLRQLREIGMSLTTARSVLDASPDEALGLVDEHIDLVVSDATTARRQAANIKASLTHPSAAMLLSVSGPMLAAAIEQILTATAEEPGIAVLGGVHFKAQSGAVVVTATDRYRLSTRTLPATAPAVMEWAATVNGEDLRSCLADLRRTPQAQMEASDHGVWIRLLDRRDRHCRLLTEPFPDYQSMLAALPAPTTRVEASRVLLLHSLEEQSAPLIQLCVNASDITVRSTSSEMGAALPARVSGPTIELWFEMTTLYPALSTAIGADVLIDLRGPDQPVTIRSADHGDLTTTAMPAMAPPSEEPALSKEHNT